MITITTTTCRIKNSDGSLADGYLIVTPNDSFEFTDSGVRVKVSSESIRQTFTAGVLDATFTIAPTINASQDKSNLYYTAQFFTNAGMWTEYWTIDANGGNLELTAITQVIVSPVASTVSYLSTDDVSTTSIPDGVPRAGSDGTINTGWLVAGGGTLVYSFTGHPLPIPPAGITIAEGYDPVDDVTAVYAGGRWRITGG